MLSRLGYPVLLSITGLLLFLLPLVPANQLAENTESYTGNNTFLCTINGSEVDKNTSLQAELSHTSEVFYLSLRTGIENRITFVLKEKEITETTYELDHPSDRYLSFLFHGKECTYSSDEYYTGLLMIHKYDKANKIIAGSFEFMAYSSDCDELIRITDGSFDATYRAK